MSTIDTSNGVDPFLTPRTDLAAAASTAPTTGASSAERAQLEKLAREFESMLLLQVMRQVRQTVSSLDGDGDDESGGGLGANMGTMNDTIDAELAHYLTDAGGFGLAASLTRSFANTTPQAPPPIQNLSAPSELVPASAPAIAAPMEAVAADAEITTVSPSRPAGHVTSPYGWRVDPIQHTRKFHGGVDIRAAYGEDVPSAASGRVVVARAERDYGMTVVVEHGNGFRTRYAHLSSLNVTEGDVVAEGQPVGRVGQSGRATAPHLHFELIRDGQRVDPSSVPAQEFKDLLARAEAPARSRS